jgi:hypothetical protein
MYIYIYISHAQVCVCAGRLHVPSVLLQLSLQCCQRKSYFQAARHNWKERPVKTSVVDGGEKTGAVRFILCLSDAVESRYGLPLE